MSTDNQKVLERDLPEYKIDSILGRGATSTVYRAVQNTLGRFVAIKRFAPETYLPGEIAKRFEREAAMWAHFSHENLIHLYDYRVAQNTRYIILEYCDGIELRELLKSNVMLPAHVAAAISVQALAALEYLHRYGIVHRDLKPANIFVTAEGVVKLMDFGISLCPELEPITIPGQVLGTPAYMSPEQALGKEVSPVSDLFSFGVVLFEMLEGCTPIRATTWKEALDEITKGNYLSPSRKHPNALRNIITKCLNRNPRKRFPSAEVVKRKLEKFLYKMDMQNERDVVRQFLLDKKIVADEFHLFPVDVTAATLSGPLATTFSVLKGFQVPKTNLKWRKRLLFILILALVGAAYFGPIDYRPDWGALWEGLKWISSKIVSFR